MIYNALDDKLDQIRLLHIEKDERQDPKGILRCILKTVSLLDLKPSCAAFLSKRQSPESRREYLAEWIHYVNPGDVVNKFSPLRIPHPKFHRFDWGDFATLSYTWGDPNVTEDILVNDETVKVRKNLADAFRVFRQHNWFRPIHYGLWVDALCINQEDEAERGAQVAKMRVIFANSWTTVAFLGNATKTSGTAIELLKTLAETWVTSAEIPPTMLFDLQVDPGAFGHGKWLALHDFLQRPYWSRLWIVQEVALAPDNMLMLAGYDSITWRQVRDALSAIHVHFWYVKDVCFDHDRKLLPNTQGVPESWQDRTLHHINKDLGRIALKTDLGEEGMGISELLEVASATSSFYTVDKIYGLLAIMPESISDQIVVDYHINETRLFETVARLFIRRDGCSEVLRTGSLWSREDIATWAPDWTWDGGRRDMLKPGLPYQVDKGTTPVISFSPDGRLLTARGVVLDEVDHLASMVDSNSGSSTSEGLENCERQSSYLDSLVRSEYTSMAATRLALHRTLVGGRRGKFGGARWELDPASGTHPMYLFTLPGRFDEAIEQFKERELVSPGWQLFLVQGPRYMDWTKWRNDNDPISLTTDKSGSQICVGRVIGSEKLAPDQHWEDAYNEYFRFRHMVVGRRFVTTKLGRFAWVPEKKESQQFHAENGPVREGDLFVMVFGCSVPLVVRPHGDKLRILGEGYLDGLMDGEALEEIENGKFVVRDLTFC
ncbi:heterokaryon incompatibility protein-domain-containing protein [Annulohypoxylon nitens]|nr:heterokaryon incompatibility protein-domain-containing protein [Annulohypoxylon nitens]